MKKTLSWLVAAVALLIAGTLLATLTLAIAGLPFADEYTPYRTTHHAITTVKTDLRSASVLLMPTAGKEIRVTCYDRTDRRTLTVSESDGVLSITQAPHTFDPLDLRTWISFGGPAYEVEIAIPRTLLPNLDIKTVSGQIDCSNLRAADLDFTATSGGVTLSAVQTSGRLCVNLTSGSIKADALTAAHTLDLRTTSGTIRAGTLTGESVIVEAASGSLRIDALTARQNAALHTSSGSIRVGTLSAVRAALEASSGGIRVDALDAMLQSLETTSGSITVTLTHPEQEYAIKSATTGGFNRLPAVQAGTKRTLDVRATSGSIYADFAPAKAAP